MFLSLFVLHFNYFLYVFKNFLTSKYKKSLLQTVKILESYAVLFMLFVVCFSFNIFEVKIFSSIIFYFFWLFCVFKVKIISKLKGTPEHFSKVSSFYDLYCFYTNS